MANDELWNSLRSIFSLLEYPYAIFPRKEAPYAGNPEYHNQ